MKLKSYIFNGLNLSLLCTARNTTKTTFSPRVVSEQEIMPLLVSTDRAESYYNMESPNLGFWIRSNRQLDKFRALIKVYQAQRSLGRKKSRLRRPDMRERKERGWMSEDEKDHIPTPTTQQNLFRRTASFENMVHYIGNVHMEFGAFLNYGCFCFPGGFEDPKVHHSHGKPVDVLDAACRAHQWAYDCARYDFGENCRGRTTLYNWKGAWQEGGLEKHIECTDQVDSCAWAVCEADKFLAEELVQNYEFGYHKQNSGNYGFDRSEHCVHRQVFVDEIEESDVTEAPNGELILPETGGEDGLNMNNGVGGFGGSFEGFGLRTGNSNGISINDTDYDYYNDTTVEPTTIEITTATVLLTTILDTTLLPSSASSTTNALDNEVIVDFLQSTGAGSEKKIKKKKMKKERKLRKIVTENGDEEIVEVIVEEVEDIAEERSDGIETGSGEMDLEDDDFQEFLLLADGVTTSEALTTTEQTTTEQTTTTMVSTTTTPEFVKLKQCCGQYPKRYMFHTNKRACCNGQHVYDSTRFQCCISGSGSSSSSLIKMLTEMC